MKQMRAVLCGYYGKGNGGDEALLASLLQLLPSHVTPLVLSGNPAQTKQDYGVEACDRMSIGAVLQALRRSDAFIWGGGSLMQDATSALNPFYYGGLMKLAQWFGLKTIAWGQGIGPLHRPTTRWLARQTFSKCTAVSVRDRASAALLSRWNIPFTLAPDPVWALQPEPVPGLWNFPAPRVAVSLRTHPQLTPTRLEALTRALVSFQTATQAFVLLIPFQPAQDMAIAQQIHAQLPNVSKILTLSNPQQLMGVFNGVEMAIAMRLHALIMAAAAGCRCFALSYDPKVTQLMEEIQLPGWTLDQMPTDSTQISQIWLEQYANGDPLLNEQIHSLVDRALMHQQVLATALTPR
ncbi:polysaccharide pyruvyl transferase CsaB [Oscillatoria sp. FACHB-1407]|uniref:polysaccharide pyruvyl transferase CsaB n=1 Tax=Oscillatoria sp. FACHB-1407 TaxID=2692847 RepID=UPI0018F02277|nr:polysaccharide pyruvyl transferase CsaB [Oscillatoria sp. FACHB-1407]